MKKKLIKLRNYWVRTNFKNAMESGNLELIKPLEYLAKEAEEQCKETDLSFDYALSHPRIKRKWKLFFVEFMIISKTK